MKILKINLEKPEMEVIAQAVDALKRGLVVMHATETCYGFAADIFNQNALTNLYTLKKMALEKPTSMMVQNVEEAKKYAVFREAALKCAQQFWPGPVTLVLPRQKSLPDFFNPGHKKVGMRCPDSLITQSLLENFGGPLTTTSANLSGLPEVYNVPDFLKQIGSKDLPELGCILDGGVISKNPPSTLVDFSGPEIKILRRGTLVEKVQEFILNLIPIGGYE